MTRARLPLEGIRVLDLGAIVSAPFAARCLQDLGASVIKVEPLSGDPLRGGPQTRGRRRFNFLSVNRGRRSIALNLKEDAGRAVFHRLLRQTDVVIENFRPGVAKRLGVDGASLRALKPSLIHCAITGFPEESPRALQPITDGVMQAYCGVLELTGDARGPGAPVPMIVADGIAGATAAEAILAALFQRERTGEGSQITISMMEGLLSWIHLTANLHTSHGPPSTCRFRAADDKTILVQPVLHFFAAFARTVHALAHCPELLADPRFATPEMRAQNCDALMHLLNAAFLRRTSDDWLHALAEAGVPAGPINTLEQAIRAPEAQAVEVSLDTDTMFLTRSPYVIDGARAPTSTSTPTLGEHTAEVLLEAGYNQEEVAELKARGTVR